MLKALAEVGSALLFPKICETCNRTLPSYDHSGVCGECAAKLIKIAPPFCPGCARTTTTANRLCGQCGPGPYHFDRAYAALYYEGKTRELLQALKFSERKTLAGFFVDILFDLISKHPGINTFDALAAVPMETRKENDRGFNQARLLCSSLARKLAKPDLSAKFASKKTPYHQSLLNRPERAKNVAGRFTVTSPAIFMGKSILLVDDILTTGFTASECAKTLKSAGAASVIVAVVARGY